MLDHLCCLFDYLSVRSGLLTLWSQHTPKYTQFWARRSVNAVRSGSNPYLLANEYKPILYIPSSREQIADIATAEAAAPASSLMRWPCRASLPLLLLVLLTGSCLGPQAVAAHQHDAHEGCGQHHPMVAQQHAVLHRRLQQLRAAGAVYAYEDAGSGGSSSSSSSSTHKTTAATGAAASGNNVNGKAKHAGDNQRQPGSSSGQQRPAGAKPQTQAPARTASSKATAAKFRIGTVFQLSGLSAANEKRVKQQLVPAAVKVLQRFIKVVRPAGRVLKVDAFFGDGQQGCLISKVDASLAVGNAGAKDTDLVLYITSDGPTCLPGMIAIATACDVDPVTKRPILGSLNICADALKGLGGLKPGSDAEAVAVGRVVEVLVHEIVHVMGFGSTHYEDWRGPDGKLYGESNVIKEVGGRPFLATPKVTSVARKFFGCSTLPGAPLENEGPSFSAVSHFEYRLLQRELMGPARPIDRSRTRLSAFTLATLEDTGWYVADYSSAEVLDWGRGAGCAFVLDTCWGYMEKNKQQPYYCGKGSVNQTRCTAEAAGWGVCRSNAFSDGCLLVGKYSASTAAVVEASVKPSSEDGRQAACYSPPQLQQMAAAAARGGGGSSSSRRQPGSTSLLPLLGGSYSAQRSDICYNLVQPQAQGARDRSDITWVGNHGQLPEDIGKSASDTAAEIAASQARAGSAAAAGSTAGSSSNRAPGGQQQQQQKRQQGLQERSADSARSGRAMLPQTRFTYMDEGTVRPQAAACVKVSPTAAVPAASETPEQALQSSRSSRNLLSTLSGMLFGADNRNSESSSRHLASAASASSVTSSQMAYSSLAATAACTSSPVLCFKSSCNKQGQLWITASGSGGSGSTSSFACPSGTTVDLSRQLPGRYLWGFLRCPSNALVCESMGCSDCSASGGYCSRGKCYCHMERHGKGCRQTLVPSIK